jgi:type II secretory pathway pseudopilin PulG
VLAAVALPAYADYTNRAKMQIAYMESQTARDAVAGYYDANEAIPATLAELGVPTSLAGGVKLELDPQNMVLSVSNQRAGMVFIPSRNEAGQIVWRCQAAEGTKPALLPPPCR